MLVDDDQRWLDSVSCLHASIKLTVDNLYLNLFCHIKSDFEETRSECYESKGLQLSYRADFEYLHKLC